jgi:TolA-binding protein
MKKFLVLALIILFVFVGCTPTETAPVVEEDTITPDVVVEDTTPVLEGVEFNSNEARRDAADEKVAKALEADVQIAEDKKRLDEISATRPLKVSDCEVVQNPEFKESCLVFAAASEESED